MRKYGICFGLAFLLGLSAGYFCFREGVRDDGDGAHGAGVRLEEARERERAAEAGIGEAEDRALRITESIGESQDGIRQVAGLKNQVQEQETLLESANQSLAEYEKEEKKKNKTLRPQRNLAYGVAIASVVAYVKK